MGDCSTCLYKDDCVADCLGYQRDEEMEAAYADYLELQADIERDERD